MKRCNLNPEKEQKEQLKRNRCPQNILTVINWATLIVVVKLGILLLYRDNIEDGMPGYSRLASKRDRYQDRYQIALYEHKTIETIIHFL